MFIKKRLESYSGPKQSTTADYASRYKIYVLGLDVYQFGSGYGGFFFTKWQRSVLVQWTSGFDRIQYFRKTFSHTKPLTMYAHTLGRRRCRGRTEFSLCVFPAVETIVLYTSSPNEIQFRDTPRRFNHQKPPTFSNADEIIPCALNNEIRLLVCVHARRIASSLSSRKPPLSNAAALRWTRKESVYRAHTHRRRSCSVKRSFIIIFFFFIFFLRGWLFSNFFPETIRP